MGEGPHLYKIRGQVLPDERLVPRRDAHADRARRSPDGALGSQPGGQPRRGLRLRRGQSAGAAAAGSPPPPPFAVRAGNADAPGRNAIHQGGIVDTPAGEWWGFSMMDANSVGRLTALSPVTWTDGWPYFGLPKNLGRSPRTWVKPRTGATTPPTAPYRRSDDFSAARAPADLAVEPRARRRQVVARRAQGAPASARARRAAICSPRATR